MNRRDLVTGLGAAAMLSSNAASGAEKKNSILELKTWFLHNSPEDQAKRLTNYFQNGMAPALERAAVHLCGVFANVIGQSGPYFVTVTEFASWSDFGAAREKLAADAEHHAAEGKLAAAGAPFVRVESSLLRSFDVLPRASQLDSRKKIVELRTYEAPSYAALTRKVGMFNDGEAKIFERLGMAPVFFGEAISGPRQPNLSYMLSYDSLAARDSLWQQFGSDPEWKRLSSIPELKDAEIVSNISNAILRPIWFSSGS